MAPRPTRHPDSRRLVMPFEDGSTEIVAVGVTDIALVPKSGSLRLVAPIPSDLPAGTFRTAHTIRPPDLANGLKALCIIDQVVDLYEYSIASAFSIHGLSSQVRDAQNNYAKTMEKSRAISSLDGFSQPTRNPS